MTKSKHRLAADALACAGDLLVFNCLPAAYAHDSWLGMWTDVLQPRETASRRTLCRVSAALLDRHGLGSERIVELGGRAWLLWPDELLQLAATELGSAMLGGWVRNGLEREDVALQRRYMSPRQRSAALGYTARFPALGFPGSAWPLADDHRTALPALGASCMAALAGQWNDGASQRLAFRFPLGWVTPLTLDSAQREEASQLLAEIQQRHAAAPGWLDRLQWSGLQ